MTFPREIQYFAIIIMTRTLIQLIYIYIYNRDITFSSSRAVNIIHHSKNIIIINRSLYPRKAQHITQSAKCIREKAFVTP